MLSFSKEVKLNILQNKFSPQKNPQTFCFFSSSKIKIKLNTFYFFILKKGKFANQHKFFSKKRKMKYIFLTNLFRPQKVQVKHIFANHLLIMFTDV